MKGEKSPFDISFLKYTTKSRRERVSMNKEDNKLLKTIIALNVVSIVLNIINLVL